MTSSGLVVKAEMALHFPDERSYSYNFGVYYSCIVEMGF